MGEGEVWGVCGGGRLGIGLQQSVRKRLKRCGGHAPAPRPRIGGRGGGERKECRRLGRVLGGGANRGRRDGGVRPPFLRGVTSASSSALPALAHGARGVGSPPGGSTKPASCENKPAGRAPGTQRLQSIHEKVGGVETVRVTLCESRSKSCFVWAGRGGAAAGRGARGRPRYRGGVKGCNERASEERGAGNTA